MIVHKFHNKQGLGNQLWCYAVIRTIALDSNYEYGFEDTKIFKGKNFFNLDFGKTVKCSLENYREKSTYHPIYKQHCGIEKIDKNLINVKDGTKIAGTMQSELYIYHRKKEICNWFKIKEYSQTYDPDNSCIINFRGGDFRNLIRYLNLDYYRNAINYMKILYPNITFYIVTDDPITAHQHFNYEILGRAKNGVSYFDHKTDQDVGDIGIDYSILNTAKYLILSNSSFGWWAAWTNKNIKTVIAPMYWTAYNFSDGFWATEDILTKNWLYLDKNNNILDYDSCLRNKIEYEEKNKHLWI
jgi:Glycosyl transferase family 11